MLTSGLLVIISYMKDLAPEIIWCIGMLAKQRLDIINLLPEDKCFTLPRIYPLCDFLN